MSGKRDTRYAHAYSKGQGVRFTSQGSWRPQAPCTIQTEALGTPVVVPARRPAPGEGEKAQGGWDPKPRAQAAKR